MNLVGLCARHLFDNNPSLGRGDKTIAGCSPVESDGKIEFFFNSYRFFNEDELYRQAVSSRLNSDQFFFEELFCHVTCLSGVLHSLYAAGFSSAAGINLRFQYAKTTEFFYTFFGLPHRFYHTTIRHWYAE